MDILEKKKPNIYKDEIKDIITLFSYDNPLTLVGSASLEAQKYPADYDFLTKVDNTDDFIPFLKGVIGNIDESLDYYFIELKFQDKKGNKKRFYPHQLIKEINEGKMKNIDFVKLDMIARIEHRFVEVSCIYQFSNFPTTEEYKKNIEKDIAELKSEGNYYKVLKREFSIYKAEKNKKKLLELTKIFNGEMGKEYQIISNLEAIQKLQTYYKDKNTNKKVLLNLKDLGLSPSTNINDAINERKIILNDKAEKLL